MATVVRQSIVLRPVPGVLFGKLQLDRSPHLVGPHNMGELTDEFQALFHASEMVSSHIENEKILKNVPICHFISSGDRALESPNLTSAELLPRFDKAASQRKVVSWLEMSLVHSHNY